jgi:hypothetical protein
MPCLRGMAPTRRQKSASLKATFGSSVATMLFSSGKAQSFQLHDHAFKRAEGRGDFEQLQVDRLVRSKHVAGGDAEEEGVADLASGTSDGNFDRLFHEGGSFLQS